jgi:ribosome-binding factor A
MSGRRLERLNEQFRREITDLLHREVRDPRVGPVTVTAVETSPDLAHAKVWVHGPEEGDRRAALLEGLRAASGFLRGELGRRLHVRRVPEFLWEWDGALEYARRIEKLLAEVRPPEQPGDDVTDGGDDDA